MRRFGILVLICCTVLGEPLLLVANASVTQASASPDQSPAMPAPAGGEEVEGKKSGWDEVGWHLALPLDLTPRPQFIFCARSPAYFSSSRELSNTLHRLLI
jgi:hypothetical protein